MEHGRDGVTVLASTPPAGAPAGVGGDVAEGNAPMVERHDNVAPRMAVDVSVVRDIAALPYDGEHIVQPQKARHKRRPRSSINRFRLVNLLDSSGVHHRDSIRNREGFAGTGQQTDQS